MKKTILITLTTDIDLNTKEKEFFVNGVKCSENVMINVDSLMIEAHGSHAVIIEDKTHRHVRTIEVFEHQYLEGLVRMASKAEDKK